jgi:hypothetical protein
MAITTTTLTSACSATDVSIHVASATGITAPNFQTGSGITILVIEQERMVCIAAPNGTFIPVIRGQGGSVQTAHANSALVFIGTPTDFASFVQIFGSLMTSQQTQEGVTQNAVKLFGSADAVLSSVSSYNVVMTASADAITLPTPVAGDEGNIIDIWSATAQAHTVTAASAAFAVASASGLRTICTFPAQIGAGIKLRVCNLLYHVIATGGTGTNSGPVVWT